VLLFTLLVPPGEFSAWAQDKDKNKQAPAAQTAPGFSISVTVPVVSVDVVVTDNNGNYLKDLKKENFRISEDGTVQTITNFAPSEAPITIVLLLEFSKLGYQFFTANARSWSVAFLNNLKPNDWVALETFNMRSNVDVDFTHNRDEIMQGLYSMVFPPFSESNLFDSLSDVLDRIKDVKGKKAVLVLASGIDTFSRMTLDRIVLHESGRWSIRPAIDLYSGAKSAQDLCGDDGRPFVAPALRRRNSRHHAGHSHELAQPVQHGLFAHQRDARRQIPQDQSGAGGAGRRSADSAGPEGEKGQVSGVRQARIYGAENERRP
jgi:hypothetical protein